MMTAFSALLVMQSALVSADAASYASAYEQAQSTGRPLVVVIGADWCPACQTMKNHTMANMARSGKLGGVAYAHVNSDREPSVAQGMMSGSLIPQLVVYAKTPTGWKKFHAMGGQSEGQIEAMIQAAQAVQKQPAVAVSTTR